MEVYLLGSAIAFALTIVLILIQEISLLSLSRIERLHYEYIGGEFGGNMTAKDVLANAVLSWIGVAFILLSFMMFVICLFTMKR